MSNRLKLTHFLHFFLWHKSQFAFTFAWHEAITRCLPYHPFHGKSVLCLNWKSNNSYNNFFCNAINYLIIISSAKIETPQLANWPPSWKRYEGMVSQGKKYAINFRLQLYYSWVLSRSFHHPYPKILPYIPFCVFNTWKA